MSTEVRASRTSSEPSRPNVRPFPQGPRQADAAERADLGKQCRQALKNRGGEEPGSIALRVGGIGSHRGAYRRAVNPCIGSRPSESLLAHFVTSRNHHSSMTACLTCVGKPSRV